MSRYVAFLRGINVGGHRVTGDELAVIFADAGHRDVSTFLASGNVLFTAGSAPDTNALSAAYKDAFGYDVPMCVRSKTELDALAASTPFSAGELEAGGKAQVIFLLDPPKRLVVSAEIEKLVPDGELIRAGRSELHWLPADGISTSTFKVDALAKVVGPITIRTRNTIDRLVKKL